MARSAQIIGSLRGLTIPASGMYVGAEDADSNRNFTQPLGIETEMGRRMAIRRQHYSWLTVVPSGFEQNNATLRSPRVLSMVGMAGYGNFPMVTANPNGSANVYSNASGHHGIHCIPDGDFDSYFNASADGIKALGDPVFVNLWFEFNGAHNNYYAGYQGGIGSSLGSRGAGEQGFVDSYQYVVNKFRSRGANNAIFCWTAQGPTSSGFYQNYYPGDAFVDVICTDLYRATFAARCTNPGAYNGGTGSQDYYNFAMGTTLTASQATALGRVQGVVKPFGIAEAGLRDGQGILDVTAAGGDGKTYFKNADNGNDAVAKLLADMKAHPNCIIYVHWNELGDPTLSGTGNYVDIPAGAKPRYSALYNDSAMGLTYAPGSLAAPTNSVPPSLSTGSPVKSTPVTCDPGTWDGSPIPTITFQWQKDGANISGQTSSSYTPVTGDIGHTLDCVVTATNSQGSASLEAGPTAAVVDVGTGSLSTSPFGSAPDFHSSLWTASNNHAGRVNDVVVHNGVVYVSGDFDTVVDNTNNTAHTDRPYLAAYRADTGALMPWKPQPSATCNRMWLSADGSVLYVAYEGTTVLGATRRYVFAVNTLTGVTDSSAASLSSRWPDLNMGGNARIVVLDEANSRGWVGGVLYLKRVTYSSGAWSIDTAFNPPAWSNGGGTGTPLVRALKLKPDGTKLLVGGQNITPTLACVNPDTGSSLGFTYQPPATPGVFEIDGDNTAVAIGGGTDSGNILFVTNWSGGGPNSLVHLSGTDNGYWYHLCDGNVQCVFIDVATNTLYYGHHGSNAATNVSSTTLNVTRNGLVSLPWSTSGGTIQPYGNPPSFTNPVVNGAATGSPLKLFTIYKDPASGNLYCGGDFTGVNALAGNSVQRLAQFNFTGVLPVPSNLTIPTIDNTTPAEGDTLTGSDGTWSNSPTSFNRQWYRQDTSGTQTAISSATGTTYQVVHADDGFKIVYQVIATNGSGASAPAQSTATARVPTTGTPSTPVLDVSSLPPNPDTSITPTFTWSDVDPVDHYRYRITDGGVTGSWITITAATVKLSLHTGTFKFEVQAGNASNSYSASASYSWTISAGVVADPVFIFHPPTPTHAVSHGFAWSQSGADATYRWRTRLVTNGSPATWNPWQSYMVHNEPGPLSPASYSVDIQAQDGAGNQSGIVSAPFVVQSPSGTASPQLTAFPPEVDSQTSTTFGWV